MQQKPVLHVCVHPLIFQVSLFPPSSLCGCHFQTFHSNCVAVCLPAVLSLFPSARVNVNASCCSSQTVPRETDQPHRRGNPLFCLKERGHGKRRKGLLFLCTPTSFLILTCRCVEGNSGLNHVVKLPGSTVQNERRRKEGMTSLKRKGGFLQINLGN